MTDTTSITTLLARSRQGDLVARDRVTILLYNELRKIARKRLPHAWGEAMQPTELVHEVSIKFPDLEKAAQQLGGRKNFLLYLSRCMANLIIDAARHRAAGRAGGGWVQLESDTNDLCELLDASSGGLQVNADPAYIDLHTAVDTLPKDLREVVELKYWLGMTDKEAAVELGKTAAEVQSEWKRAKLILERSLNATATGSAEDEQQKP